MASPLTDYLRALPDDALRGLFARRPDLLTPAPSDMSSLAARLQSRVSVGRALDGLDLFTLEILDAARLTRSPAGVTSVAAITAAAAGVEAGIVRAAIGRLKNLLILYGSDEALHVVPSVDEVCSAYPAGLGRSAAVLGADVAALVADPAGLRRALLAVPPAGRAILDRLAAGPPVGSATAEALADPAATVGALVARGLLAVTGPETVELPREVGQALRRAGPLGPLHPRPPVGSVEPPLVKPVKSIDSAGTGQVMDAVRQTEDLLAALDAEPATALRTGGMGVRDVRRLARAAGVTEPAAVVLLEVAAAAGLLGETDAVTATSESRFLPTLGYDQWQAAPTAAQWVRLARAWLVMNRQPGLAGRRVGSAGNGSATPTAIAVGDEAPIAGRIGARSSADRSLNVLAPELERTGAPRLRAAVLDVLAEMPPGATPDIEDVLAALHWQTPRRAPWPPGPGDPAASEPARWVLAEAAQLGVTGLGAVTSYGRRLVEEVRAAAGQDPDADPLGRHTPDSDSRSPAAAALDKLLPPPVDHVLVQADLTVVVPGPPEPGLATELDMVADHESAGGASVFRVTPDSVRRALDAGYSAADLHALLRRRSRTPVPQALAYLIDDVARRHGGLRLGTAGSYLRSEDAPLLAEVAADKRLAGLALRVIAPTVLVSSATAPRLIAALREAGYAPVQEDVGGGSVIARVKVLRAPPRRTPLVLSAFAGGDPDPRSPRLAAAVEALRRGDVAAVAARRAPIAVRTASNGAADAQAHTQAMAVLQQAIRDKARVWVGYVDAHGSAASRLLRPVSIGAGYLRAEDERTEMLHTFALHRITAAVLDN